MVRNMHIQCLAPFSRPVAVLIACVCMALSSAIHLSTPVVAGEDARQIRALIGATWDTLESRVETDPVVVSGDHAVASWIQGPRGGRALLKRRGGKWHVVLCSGDPLKDAAWLGEAGVPASDAERLAETLREAEASVSDSRRAQFSLFEGVVEGPHGPADTHPHSHH